MRSVASARADSLLIRLLQTEELSNVNLEPYTRLIVHQAREYIRLQDDTAGERVADMLLKDESFDRLQSNALTALVSLMEAVADCKLSRESLYAVMNRVLYGLALWTPAESFDEDDLKNALEHQEYYKVVREEQLRDAEFRQAEKKEEIPDASEIEEVDADATDVITAQEESVLPGNVG